MTIPEAVGLVVLGLGAIWALFKFILVVKQLDKTVNNGLVKKLEEISGKLSTMSTQWGDHLDRCHDDMSRLEGNIHDLQLRPGCDEDRAKEVDDVR